MNHPTRKAPREFIVPLDEREREVSAVGEQGTLLLQMLPILQSLLEGFGLICKSQRNYSKSLADVVVTLSVCGFSQATIRKLVEAERTQIKYVPPHPGRSVK